MPTQVAIVFVPAGPFDEKYATTAISYCHSRGYFPAAVVHGDWRAVDLLLAERLAQTVIVARHDYPVAGHDGAEQMPADWPRRDVQTYELPDEAIQYVRRRYQKNNASGTRVYAVPGWTRAHDLVEQAAKRWGFDR